MKKSLIYIVLSISHFVIAQNEDLFDRLRAIDNNGITFYNIDGVDFSKQTLDLDFTDKNLKKAYRMYGVKKKDIKTEDPAINFTNYRIQKEEQHKGGLKAINSYYFVKNKKGSIDAFSFGYYDTHDIDLEHRIIPLILKDAIPESCYSSIQVDTINFVGREIALGGNCNWMNINNIQCPYYGQMNWSIHKSRESAALSIEQQLRVTKLKKGGKVVSEEEVSILFEGVPTIAKKVHYDFTGATAIMASMSGGKNLTIYYVSEKVRNHFVSCVLSFWNNDTINPSGLPPLLEKVMKEPN